MKLGDPMDEDTGLGPLSSEGQRDTVLDQVDKAKKEPLLALAQELGEKVDFSEVYFVSALTGDGVPELKDALAKLMPEGPWMYPEDQVSDASERLLATEITREQLYQQLHEELQPSGVIWITPRASPTLGSAPRLWKGTLNSALRRSTRNLASSGVRPSHTRLKPAPSAGWNIPSRPGNSPRSKYRIAITLPGNSFSDNS